MDEEIIERMRSDGSSRETLADYGAGGNSHRLRFIRRDRDGVPEIHQDIIDVVFIQSGNGTVHFGGEMIGQSNVPGARINDGAQISIRSEEHTSELQSLVNLVCRLLLEKKKK